jgi:hypothetical protein
MYGLNRVLLYAEVHLLQNIITTKNNAEILRQASKETDVEGHTDKTTDIGPMCIAINMVCSQNQQRNSYSNITLRYVSFKMLR